MSNRSLIPYAAVVIALLLDAYSAPGDCTLGCYQVKSPDERYLSSAGGQQFCRGWSDTYAPPINMWSPAPIPGGSQPNGLNPPTLTRTEYTGCSSACSGINGNVVATGGMSGTATTDPQRLCFEMLPPPSGP